MEKERLRSHWAWGWEDRFPTLEERQAYAMMVASLLGLETPPEPMSPVPLEAIELRAPRVLPPSDLGAIADWGHEARVRHTHGRSYPDQVEGFYGRFSHPPDGVFFPRNEAEVLAILTWAEGRKVAVVPFGGGSSVVGGISPEVGEGFAGVVSLDMSKMDALLEVDKVSRLARFQAGVMGPALEESLRPHGLTLRHFPQSFEFSSLGGWIATRAGGHFATLYTHIDELLAGCRMVTPRGIYASRPLPATGAGPRPDGLVLGSEGSFGVITEAWMRCQLRPAYRLGATVYFEAFDAGVEAVKNIAQAGLYPANCRLLDPQEATLNGVSDGEAVLILAFESADHDVSSKMERALGLALSGGGRCPKGVVDRGEGASSSKGGGSETWKQAFINAPYLQPILISCGIMADTFETCTTWAKFPALHQDILDSVGAALEAQCGGGRISCRFTHVYPDGPAPYYTFLAPVEVGREIEVWRVVKAAAADAILRSGGTITHHHAVGRVHRPWYVEEVPAPFLKMLRGAKREVDPRGIMNPGALIPGG